MRARESEPSPPAAPPPERSSPPRPARPGRRRRRRSLPLRLALAALALLVLAAGGAAVFYLRADARLHHVAALTRHGARPAAGKGTDWLLVGTDTRTDLTPRQRRDLHVGGGAEHNTDTLMLLHYGRSGPYLVSIPRDSYVAVPGHGKRKINSAYALGGPELLTRTVERATGLHVDHYAEIDLLGLVRTVDALHGVRVCLDRPLDDAEAGAHLPAGCRKLDGTEALAYARARHSDPRGDLGRAERQRTLIGALVHDAADPGDLLTSARLRPLLKAALKSVTVDDTTDLMSLTRMAWKLKGLTNGHGATTTVPVARPGTVVPGAGDVLIWDKRAARELFDRLRQDVPVTASPTP